MLNPAGYDFRRCKFCGEQAAEPVYHLGENLLIYVCGRCDFHSLNRLDPDKIESPGLNQLSEAYIDKRLDESLSLLSKRLALVSRQLSLDGARCLDIGAGVGQFLLALAEAGAHGEGIEPSRVRREYARKRFALELRPERVEEPYWQKFAGGFDLVTLWDVIEHVNFPVETLQQAIRLLKPGGWLFLDTPSRLTLSYRLSQLAARLSGGQLPLFLPSLYSATPYGHKQIFTPNQLRLLLKRLGLQLLSYRRSLISSALRRDRIILSCRKSNS